MNQLKSSIRSKENVRKRNFVIKLVILIVLEVIYAGDTFFRPFLEKFEITYDRLLKNVHNLIFPLGWSYLLKLKRFFFLCVFLVF